jgi:hypothetical protein
MYASILELNDVLVILTYSSFIAINTYWDRTSKAIILIVDASLNYYFLRVVKQRLVKNHRLTKYRPLVTYNARLMLVSIIMEVRLLPPLACPLPLTPPQATIIGLLPLPNELLYAQFHPVAYMMKLNIEMTMASLIKKIALSAVAEQEHMPQCAAHESALEHGTYSSASAKFRHSSAPGAEQDADRIRATTEAQVRVEEVLVGDGEREGFGDGGAYRGLGRGL